VSGARWREDEALVDAVTHLTEWPDVLLGNFEADYLELPEEVLVTVMRDHQKYFAVEDASGKLAPHFLTVTNIALDEVNAPIIKQGNERVLKARFNDARFFWEFDQRIRLQERASLLQNVTFQKELGSYAEKSLRVHQIAEQLETLSNSRGVSLSRGTVPYAVMLAKTDLTTELVKEFTELQGIIGGLYAKAEGIDDVVAEAVYDQYLPASASDRIPRSFEGCVLGLADRIDTINGMFSLDMVPTGSKDPFALRRAANAVVRILAESTLPLKLSDVIQAASPRPEVADKLASFFSERIDFYLREGLGQTYDVAKAVIAAGTDDLPDLVARAQAITAVRGREDFMAVSAAFKRMKNLLAAAKKDNIEPAFFVNHELLKEEAELTLMQQAKSMGFNADRFRKEKNYALVMEAIAMLRPPVDDFFDKVMVLVQGDDALRANRLALLVEVLKNFEGIADFSEIVTAG
jgi:glycyl-tRNA synthetase beta chain